MKRRGDWATKVVNVMVALGVLIIIFGLVILVGSIAGCASTEVPKPLIGEVRTETVYVATPVACADESKLAKRPPVHAAKVGSDAVQHASGMKADAEDLRLYAAELEAEIRRCSKLPPKPETK